MTWAKQDHFCHLNVGDTVFLAACFSQIVKEFGETCSNNTHYSKTLNITVDKLFDTSEHQLKHGV